MQEGDKNMTTMPTYKWKQPHIEQAHRYLEDALSELGKARSHAQILDDRGLENALEEVECLLRDARNILPPKQMKLPLGK
jgi:hypothetical protein